MAFPLPNNVKQDTVVSKFENNTVVLVTAATGTWMIKTLFYLKYIYNKNNYLGQPSANHRKNTN